MIDPEIKAELEELFGQFNDPDGVIDDAEELLNDIPDWIETILELDAEVDRLRDKLINQDPNFVPTPDQFKTTMKTICKPDGIWRGRVSATTHRAADRAIADMLRRLGYGAGVDFYDALGKSYEDGS